MIEQLRALIERDIAAGLTRGMQLFVAQHGRTLIDEALGVRGQDDDLVTTLTRFNLFSATKPITATALHLLVDQGHVSYDDPVVRFVPDFGRHGKDAVTVGHLLTHQAGIPDTDEVVPVAAFADFPDAVARICALEPTSPPGGAVTYHPLTGAAMVAEVVQRVSGEDFRRFCADHVLTPLGMTHTTYGLPDLLTDETSDTVGATPERAAVADVWRAREARRALHPGIGAHSTARDLARLYQTWLDEGVYDGGRLVAEKTVALATSVVAPTLPSAGFGLGFIVGVDPAGSSRGVLCSERTFGHPGMCSTQAYADPSNGLVVVLLANVDPGQEESDRRFSILCNTIQRGVIDG